MEVGDDLCGRDMDKTLIKNTSGQKKEAAKTLIKLQKHENY